MSLLKKVVAFLDTPEGEECIKKIVKDQKAKSVPNYHGIALNNARVIESFAKILPERNETIRSLKAEIEELNKELITMDKAHYRCSQRCLGHIEEVEKLKEENKQVQELKGLKEKAEIKNMLLIILTIVLTFILFLK
jgi:hypothetical protein